MNTPRESVRRRRLIRISAVVAAGLVTAGLAAAGTVPARAGTLGPAPAVTTAVNQQLLREGSRDAAVRDWHATLDKLAAAGKPGQAKIATDSIFGPKTIVATQAFQRGAHITAYEIVGVQT
jgi:peptidoglycan hydrolase-like protein with peptidoglycan-binding domain